MRKFIVSDLHGDGNVYKSIMNYLDNISRDEEVILYINGDIIDRGIDSSDMILDVREKINNSNYKIIYLGGNHELLMYQYYKEKRNYFYNSWYDNGGWITDYGLDDKFNYDKGKKLDVVDFVGDLGLYHVFDEKIKGKNIMLVHAACPYELKDVKIKDNNELVDFCVWTREYDPWTRARYNLGNKNYFTIVGHTPNENKYGYVYNDRGNYLNIDGGCSRYVMGDFWCDHVPLVEVLDNCLKILTFNNNNEIIYGNYFDGKNSIPVDNKELDRDREYINKNLKIKKLVRYDDDVINYEE